jgi:hypothetical protein
MSERNSPPLRLQPQSALPRSWKPSGSELVLRLPAHLGRRHQIAAMLVNTCWILPNEDYWHD